MGHFIRDCPELLKPAEVILEKSNSVKGNEKAGDKGPTGADRKEFQAPNIRHTRRRPQPRQISKKTINWFSPLLIDVNSPFQDLSDVDTTAEEEPPEEETQEKGTKYKA